MSDYTTPTTDTTNGNESTAESRTLRLALAQLEVEPTAVEANVDRALEAIGRAAERGADLVALPELFNVGYFAFDSYERLAEPLEGETFERIREAAAERDVAVLAGSIVEDLAATESAARPADEGLANTTALFDADGERRLVYRKHHLFGYQSAESELLVPGERIETATVAGVTIGATTCYDLRFPALYRQLIDDGAELLLIPSAWPYPRIEHWETLSRARAIENQAFVATINGSGRFDDADATLLGRSTVYDPWGTTLASSSDEPTLVVADLDLEAVARVREEFPALRDRRL
ncbi:carbon-nitrogen family hydrolase [Natronolimnohabitans innermongolicus]|uniref:Nitrilase/cyanide hydratase and apolipoprotein N-acyltransferase n=1 Tax=Natronolimnohabitans innermongolicus JCM 12255 TaxID=1227499 RepID=L9XL33_9EURY|nr:carbon-nitrogen family hydrolase [Natronolimnohabitans innermongolicus]ELY62096.1 nitrilase/cyanide hydratase and apolipoprotein N- acyltransferase [Natronolimnohabitans innermongolicus JCM 12255]